MTRILNKKLPPLPREQIRKKDQIEKGEKRRYRRERGRQGGRRDEGRVSIYLTQTRLSRIVNLKFPQTLLHTSVRVVITCWCPTFKRFLPGVAWMAFQYISSVFVRVRVAGIESILRWRIGREGKGAERREEVRRRGTVNCSCGRANVCNRGGCRARKLHG